MEVSTLTYNLGNLGFWMCSTGWFKQNCFRSHCSPIVGCWPFILWAIWANHYGLVFAKSAIHWNILSYMKLIDQCFPLLFKRLSVRRLFGNPIFFLLQKKPLILIFFLVLTLISLRPPSWWNQTSKKISFFCKYFYYNSWEKYLKLSQKLNSTLSCLGFNWEVFISHLKKHLEYLDTAKWGAHLKNISGSKYVSNIRTVNSCPTHSAHVAKQNWGLKLKTFGKAFQLTTDGVICRSVCVFTLA